MDRIFLFVGATPSAILLISVIAPTWVYMRLLRSVVLPSILSFFLYLLLVNAYFHMGAVLGIGFYPSFGEAHGAGWVVCIVATVGCCRIVHRVRTARPSILPLPPDAQKARRR